MRCIHTKNHYILRPKYCPVDIMFSLCDVVLDSLYPCFLYSDIHPMHFECMYLNLEKSITIGIKTNHSDL